MYSHHEPHFNNRNGWLRASVLGANDGLISTASLLIGVVAANVNDQTVILTGVAALIGGAISMASGEYVSVSSQADTEKADLAKEAYELEHNAERELKELTAIYEMRGLDTTLATQVAIALTQHNALEAHARDEMGLTETGAANPFQATPATSRGASPLRWRAHPPKLRARTSLKTAPSPHLATAFRHGRPPLRRCGARCPAWA